MKYYIGVQQDVLEEKISMDAYTYYSEGGDRFVDVVGNAWESILNTLTEYGFSEVDRGMYHKIKTAHISMSTHYIGYLIYEGNNPLPEEVYDDEYLAYFQEITNGINHILGIKKELL